MLLNKWICNKCLKEEIMATAPTNNEIKKIKELNK